MLAQEEKSQGNSIPVDGQLLTSEEYQEEMANRIADEVFQTEDHAEKTAGVISSFIQSYEKHKHDQSLDEWLSAEFKKYPEIWANEEEIEATTREVINAITVSNQTKASLQVHLDQGKSEASWLAKEIEKGATVSAAVNMGAYADGIEKSLLEANKASGVVNVAAYADVIEQSLTQSNQNNWDVITRKDGFISQNPNLDGFIAEHDYANTFNLDASAKGIADRARVLEPEPGQTYGKNSMDIGIYDGNGKLLKRYQLKCGTDAEATKKQFENGDYRGQRKLVPKGQGKDIEGSTEMLESNGAKSSPRTKRNSKNCKTRHNKSRRQNSMNGTKSTGLP